MKTASVKELKTELGDCSHQELIELCLRLSRFKKENKELLTYLLFDSTNEDEFIKTIKREIDEEFESINITSYYFIKKSIRKILRNIKKYIRYSKNKETEIELILHFCSKLNCFAPSIHDNNVLKNIYNREIVAIKKKIILVHEDLQHDYQLELQKLSS
ncbi:hypothetical protein [Aquimarina longa]|uniref:hypothetical protein n=1 Tax=Aquimarina longa TaxID=1080221 RepID=UPI0007868084|nr:hypothetical protein [Aquimarina longa]